MFFKSLGPVKGLFLCIYACLIVYHAALSQLIFNTETWKLNETLQFLRQMLLGIFGLHVAAPNPLHPLVHVSESP